MDFIRNLWGNKQPLLWGIVIGAIVTLVVGFKVADWETGGGAQALADNRAEKALANLSLCLAEFDKLQPAERTTALKELDDTSTWQRGRFVEEKKWTEDVLAAKECASLVIQQGERI